MNSPSTGTVRSGGSTHSSSYQAPQQPCSCRPHIRSVASYVGGTRTRLSNTARRALWVSPSAHFRLRLCQESSCSSAGTPEDGDRPLLALIDELTAQIVRSRVGRGGKPQVAAPFASLRSNRRTLRPPSRIARRTNPTPRSVSYRWLTIPILAVSSTM